MKMEALDVDPGSEDGLLFMQRAQRELEIAAEQGPVSPSQRDEILNGLRREVVLHGTGFLGRSTRDTVAAGRASLGEAFEGVPADHQDAVLAAFGEEVPDPELLRPIYDQVMSEVGADVEGMSAGSAREFLVAELEDALAEAEIQMALIERAETERAAAEEEAEGGDAEEGDSGEGGAELLDPVEAYNRTFESAQNSPLIRWLRSKTDTPTPGNLRTNLVALGYPEEERERLTRPLNRRLAERIVNQGIRYGD